MDLTRQLLKCYRKQCLYVGSREHVSLAGEKHHNGAAAATMADGRCRMSATKSHFLFEGSEGEDKTGSREEQTVTG